MRWHVLHWSLHSLKHLYAETTVAAAAASPGAGVGLMPLTLPQQQVDSSTMPAPGSIVQRGVACAACRPRREVVGQSAASLPVLSSACLPLWPSSCSASGCLRRISSSLEVLPSWAAAHALLRKSTSSMLWIAWGGAL